MPVTHTGGKGTAPRVHILKRAAILALHWHASQSFSQISTKLNVPKSTASAIVERAKRRAADPNDFEDVLGCLGDWEEDHGPKAKIPEGSAESEALRALSQSDEQHWQMPFVDIAKELGVPAARSTLETVFHGHHNIFRRKPMYKPYLSENQIEARLHFAHMALHIAIHNIIFTDEMWVEFNSARRQTHVSRIRGADPFRWTIHTNNNEATKRVMFWGAIVIGYHGPYHIWEKDTEEDLERFRAIVNEENAIRLQDTQYNQKQALIEGTWQKQALDDFNVHIDQVNYEEERTGRDKRRKRKPEAMFKLKKLDFTSKGGINWVSYRERVLRPKLYPFIDELQKKTGMPITYLVEDNAPAHQGAREVDFIERKERGILTLDWPSKSPDLNAIEEVWKDEKDEIATYQFTGVGQKTVAEAKATLATVWEETSQQYIDSRCRAFHQKLEQVILHGGNNDFHG